MRIFRLRTLSASNVSGLLLAAAVFSQFFLLTLYMQQVLHYSALKTGVAYITLTAVDHRLLGARPGAGDAPRHPAGLTAGLPCRRAGSSCTHGCRCTGTTSGICSRPSCSAASGLRSRSCRCRSAARPVSPVRCRHRVGADQHQPADRRRDRRCRATTIATTFSLHYVHAHPGASALGGAALTHGFQVAFYVLAAIAAAGAVLAATLTESRAVTTAVVEPIDAEIVLEAA